MDEVPLRGGRLTPGVVRVGDTVRRPAPAFTATLLTQLAAAGFDGAPRHLGRDARGRDVLTFLPGDVPAKWRAFTDEQVAQAAVLLRRLHDASRGLTGGAVVCHHDPGPHNTVFRAGRPVAFIDFDFAAVGDPIEDVAYLAWSWCISSKGEPAREAPAGQARQVRVLADAYRLTAEQRRRLPTAIRQRLLDNERFWVEPAGPAEVIDWTRREYAFVVRHESTFAAALD